MENPYYEIVALIKSLSAQGVVGICAAEVALDDDKKPIIALDGEPVDGQFWTPDTLTLTEEDEGQTVLCVPFDQGFLVLTRINPL